MQQFCKKCQNSFEIIEEHFRFYDKISPAFGDKKYSVSPPTLCPACRQQRRLAFRNERKIYERACGLCRKEMISIYHPESPYTIYCYDCFYSDSWDQLASGREFDFEKPFFEQYYQLQLTAPKLGLQKSHDLENSEYVNHVAASKNCYLIFASVNNEECLYCNYVSYSKNIIDGLRVFKSELCYECIDCTECYNLKFSQQCQNCSESLFLYNCRSCSDCFLCTNLVQKSYCLRNEQLSKEEYFEQLQELLPKSLERLTKRWQEFQTLKEESLHKATVGYNNIDSTGDNLINTKNCIDCFDLKNAEDCAYVSYGDDVKDTMDAYGAYPRTELCYETVGTGAPSYSCQFSYLPWEGNSLLYCINAMSSKNCFGCNHIKSKQYCILNKQYSKEEYEKLLPKIIEHMQATQEWSDFFPAKFSPFAYNETVANEYFPLTKEEALAQEFLWSDYESPPPEVAKTISADQLPSNIDDIPDDILNWAVACEVTQKPFRIVQQELEFYRRHNLPIPTKHPDQRHKERFMLRNPRKLWKRRCSKCEKEIESTYDPQRKETVLCEKCYLTEVY